MGTFRSTSLLADAGITTDPGLVTDPPEITASSATTSTDPTTTTPAGREVWLGGGASWGVYVRNTNREPAGIIDTFDDLTIVLRHNKAGTWQLRLPADDPQRALLQPGYGVTVWSPDAAQPLMSGVIRQIVEDRKKVNTVTITGVDDTARLGTRLVYPDPALAATAQTTATNYVASGAAGTVIRDLVRAQAGVGALVARRIPGLTVNAASGLGSTVEVSGRFSNLLEECAALADAGGIGFRVIQWATTDDYITPLVAPAPGEIPPLTGYGTTDLRLQIYPVVDRSDRVRFTTEAGALDGWTYTLTAGAVTRAVVAGQGEGTARTILEVADTSGEADWAERVEVFVDARDTNDTDVLTQRGTVLLADAAPSGSLQATPTGTSRLAFGRDYWLGDTVTIATDTIEVAAPVTEVQIKVSSVGAQVTPTVGAAALTGPAIYRTVRDLNRRLQQLERR